MIYDSWKAGDMKAVTAMKRLNLSKNTFYRFVKEYKKEQKEIN